MSVELTRLNEVNPNSLCQKITTLSKIVDVFLHVSDIKGKGSLTLQRLDNNLGDSLHYSEVSLRFDPQERTFYLWETDDHQHGDRPPTQTIWGIKYDPEEFAQGWITFVIRRDYQGAQTMEHYINTLTITNDDPLLSEYRWKLSRLAMILWWKLEEKIGKSDFFDPLTAEFNALRKEYEGENHQLMKQVRLFAQNNFPSRE